MGSRVQDDNTQGSGSIVSGLTALESDTDDFGRLMIQNVRDERRLNDALRGNVHAFRKARTHPRVGLTLENLERNNGVNNVALGLNAQRPFDGPPSVSSSGSDPAIRPPLEWGRKGRVRKDWLKRITSDDEQKPGEQDEDTVDEDRTPRRESRATISDADIPLPSVEDSPLSHRSSHHGTPASTRRRNAALDRLPDWDLTMDLNEASLIASTPYLPRNTALDDIRQREIESLREQAVTTSRLDKIRENSPEETRRPESSSKSFLNNLISDATTSERAAQETDSSNPRLRRRTISAESISRSQPLNAEGEEPTSSSPIVVYKSAETVGVIDRDILANAQTSPKRRGHRREDSHDLLRRLARVSSGTPSPGRVAASRPQTASARQPDSSSSRMAEETSASGAKTVQTSEKSPRMPSTSETMPTAPHLQQQEVPDEERRRSVHPAGGSEKVQAADIDATPIPLDHPLLNAKTPVVTGAWIDTPAPRTGHQDVDTSRSPSRSPRRGSPKKKYPEKRKDSQSKGPLEVSPKRIKPSLPGSAVEAIVEEARASGMDQRNVDVYGDSTIDSLEDMIAPGAKIPETVDQDEDTLLGLRPSTRPPRNEAERQRQQELLHLHKMNDKLRAARTNIRDVSRGIKRVENQVEHVEGEELVRTIYPSCPCAENGHQCNLFVAMWTGFKGLFYDGTAAKRFGLTWLSRTLVLFFIWYIAEVLACDQMCHKFEASSMEGFGVKWDAPRFPFVIPTVLYRSLLRPFWKPFWNFLIWIWTTAYSCFFEDENARTQATRTALRFTTRILMQSQQTFEPDLSMNDDELI
ncbi:hypothetical protein K469DRAFT_557758 [Zopfia rhizophila CBS 207.26]|uniref:Uncharacterized protein n=1 Tax=Zopfia rhizophila CBS 207.26 TaxID=1314779 RepID=A0A6A6EIW1_9PEZI|nr:hypothetical protein K469DRAFT_557758 [Zopfia rhizophila CBS 207.26]